MYEQLFTEDNSWNFLNVQSVLYSRNLNFNPHHTTTLDNAGETRRLDPSAAKCSDHPLDQVNTNIFSLRIELLFEAEVSDPQLSAQRPRYLQHAGVRHQRRGHLLPGNLLQPWQDLGKRTEPEVSSDRSDCICPTCWQVWSLPHHWREARVSSEEDWGRCSCATPPAALPRPQPGEGGENLQLGDESGQQGRLSPARVWRLPGCGWAPPVWSDRQAATAGSAETWEGAG